MTVRFAARWVCAWVVVATDVIIVSAFVGSIVDATLGADAIVNASNPHVALGSGVSGAIADACGGVEYQHEVRSVCEDEFDEPLEAGDCLVTGAGSATGFQHVLHVPAVDYTKRDPETGASSGPTRVAHCVRAFLTEAMQRRFKVVGTLARCWTRRPRCCRVDRRDDVRDSRIRGRTLGGKVAHPLCGSRS